jgi:YD repeat-containing protein
MNIVARVVVFVLAFFALVPCQFSAAQQNATVTSGQGFNPENPDSCKTPGEFCPEPQQKPGQTGAASGPITGGGNSNTLPGESKNHLALPGADNAGQGMASCYYNYMTFVDPNFRIYQLDPDPKPGVEQVPLGCWVPVPGGAVVVWDRDPAGPCGTGCSTYPIMLPLPDGSGGWGVAANMCVCPLTDLGSPSQGDNADFAPQGQLPSVDGRPIVYQSTRSGAQAWWHLPLSELADSFIEIKHWDGTIARYKRRPGVKVQRVTADSSRTLVREGSFWQLDRTTDPYDNVTQYTYDPFGQLARISYPNGIHAHWNWNPSWKTYWSGCSGIEIRHTTDVLPPVWGAADSQPHEDSTFLVFQNIDSTHTHFSGLPLAYFGQRGSYVAKPAAGQTFDVSAEASGHAVTEFVNDAAGQVTEVRR